MVTQVPLHVAETWDSHLSLHLVWPAFDPDGHPLLQKTFPSLGLTHLQLLPGVPLTSQLLQFSLIYHPPHPQHSHMFCSFVFTFTLWMVSASSRALNAICPWLPNLDFQPRSPVNSWLLYPQHVTSIAARGHLLSSKVVMFKGELLISPSPNMLLQLSVTLW